MTTQVSFVSAWPGRASGSGPRYTAEDLAALHTHLVLQFRSMIKQHRPGCAFVSPYPGSQDLSPSEILVIPIRKGAALFSIGFLQGNRTRMVVRIGEHGVGEFSEDDQSPRSLAATAELLFGCALSGRYREEIWTQTTTGRYEGGQSYFMDESHWQELGPGSRPRTPLRLLRHKLTVQDRWYEPY